MKKHIFEEVQNEMKRNQYSKYERTLYMLKNKVSDKIVLNHPEHEINIIIACDDKKEYYEVINGYSKYYDYAR